MACRAEILTIWHVTENISQPVTQVNVRSLRGEQVARIKSRGSEGPGPVVCPAFVVCAGCIVREETETLTVVSRPGGFSGSSLSEGREAAS